VPESFTHGSSAQRMRWFQRGTVVITGNPLGAAPWPSPPAACWPATAWLLRRAGTLGDTLDGLPGVPPAASAPTAAGP
jgi:iron complex outermembrane receptor protein